MDDEICCTAGTAGTDSGCFREKNISQKNIPKQSENSPQVPAVPVTPPPLICNDDGGLPLQTDVTVADVVVAEQACAVSDVPVGESDFESKLTNLIPEVLAMTGNQTFASLKVICKEATVGAITKAVGQLLQENRIVLEGNSYSLADRAYKPHNS